MSREFLLQSTPTLNHTGKNIFENLISGLLDWSSMKSQHCRAISENKLPSDGWSQCLHLRVLSPFSFALVFSEIFLLRKGIYRARGILTTLHSLKADESIWAMSYLRNCRSHSSNANWCLNYEIGHMKLPNWCCVFEPQYDYYYMTLWLRDSNKKFMGMSKFFIKLQWSYHSLLKKF